MQAKVEWSRLLLAMRVADTHGWCNKQTCFRTYERSTVVVALEAKHLSAWPGSPTPENPSDIDGDACYDKGTSFWMKIFMNGGAP